MSTTTLQLGALLHDPAFDRRRPISVVWLLACIVCCGGAYGAVMGTFGGFTGQHPLQPIYSAIKVPILIVLSFGLCLPFFFIINTLLGLREAFGEALAALLKAQAVVTLALAALAPYTAVWYCSTSKYEPALLFNACIFAIASFAGQSVLRRLYRPLIARSARHRAMLKLWLILYAFVGIQMGWILRPFVGDPRVPVHFFREGAFSNAYVVVAKLIWHVVTRSSR
jgi:hypothetical protein